jgi:hypothetical protein
VSFPARESFDEDRRTRMHHVRVYAATRKLLNFVKPLAAPLDTIERLTGINRADVSRARADLVRWGYLIEHGRDIYRAIEYTLAWDVPAVGERPTSRPSDAA